MTVLKLVTFPASSEVTLGQLGPLFLNVWFAVPTVAALEKLQTAQRQIQGPHCVMTVLQEIPRGPLPDEAKALAARIYEEGLERVRAHANVVEVKGFFAASVRAVMTGSQLFKPGGYPMKVFADVDEATTWLTATTTTLDPACTATAVARALVVLRAR